MTEQKIGCLRLKGESGHSAQNWLALSRKEVRGEKIKKTMQDGRGQFF